MNNGINVCNIYVYFGYLLIKINRQCDSTYSLHKFCNIFKIKQDY